MQESFSQKYGPQKYDPDFVGFGEAFSPQSH